MSRFMLFIFILFTGLNTASQNTPVSRPKLVVGIVVDQMRWDYLYRFYDRYDVNGGFKRMLNNGFTCENTLIPYAPTITACGHSSIFHRVCSCYKRNQWKCLVG
ncbi:MAG: alkaline phosphatase family protein [Bacteroidota bacterium]